MKDEAPCAEWHSILDFLVIPEMHAKHSEMSLVPISGARRMWSAMISWNACVGF